MKKIFSALILILLCCFSALSDDLGNVFQVKVSETAEKETFALKKNLETKAKQAAIRKYILRLNAKTPETLLTEACNEYSIFVEESDKVSEKWESIDKKLGQLTGEYRITLKLDSLNQWMETKGLKPQGFELIIMEERPSLGQIKIDKAFGTGTTDGAKFFMTNYTMIQRRLRDAIVKKVGAFGFDVKLLEDNEMYESFKSKDGTLVGVFFDPEKNDFVIDTGLLNAVKENAPDTLVLYYRIDSLIFEESTRMIRATVAFNMKNLNNGVTKSAGAGTFGLKSKSAAIDGVIDDMAYCAEAAMNSLMNEEGAGERLIKIAMSFNNDLSANAPLKLVVNASAFDPKIQKKALYTIKKELIAKKISSESSIKTTNTTLTATIDNTKIKAADELYMEYILPILEENGFEITDDQVNYSGKTVTIKQQ